MPHAIFLRKALSCQAMVFASLLNASPLSASTNHDKSSEAAQSARCMGLAVTENHPKNPKEIDVAGWTPLHVAAAQGKADIATRLIAKGANVNATDSQGREPLYCAARNGHVDTVKVLIAKGANVNLFNKKGETLLCRSIESKNLEVVRVLVEAGANVNAVDQAGRTAIHWAAVQGETDILAYLIKIKGANVNAVDKAGRTPLDWALSKKHTSAVTILTRSGAQEAGSKTSSYWSTLEDIANESDGETTTQSESNTDMSSVSQRRLSEEENYMVLPLKETVERGNNLK